MRHTDEAAEKPAALEHLMCLLDSRTQSLDSQIRLKQVKERLDSFSQEKEQFHFSDRAQKDHKMFWCHSF